MLIFTFLDSRREDNGSGLEWVNLKKINYTKLRGYGPRANYTDRATAACWRS
jgi:hypothetical protein